jgi:hypothetical protein
MCCARRSAFSPTESDSGNNCGATTATTAVKAVGKGRAAGGVRRAERAVTVGVVLPLMGSASIRVIAVWLDG